MESAQRAAFVDSEQRFRLAVEAARCGIWEWELASRPGVPVRRDRRDVRLGRRRGGAAARSCWARVSPDHRERVRQALASAATYGAFDVSFRVPSRARRPAIWIDARGQALRRARRGPAIRAIIGVALDVTEERLAQDRAQAAETRLRDAIDSVSEAFVLWDRKGRLLMCNHATTATSSASSRRLLKPGAPTTKRGQPLRPAGHPARPARPGRPARACARPN